MTRTPLPGKLPGKLPERMTQSFPREFARGDRMTWCYMPDWVWKQCYVEDVIHAEWDAQNNMVCWYRNGQRLGLLPEEDRT